jgi:hypothetical protein
LPYPLDRGLREPPTRRSDNPSARPRWVGGRRGARPPSTVTEPRCAGRNSEDALVDDAWRTPATSASRSCQPDLSATRANSGRARAL